MAIYTGVKAEKYFTDSWFSSHWVKNMFVWKTSTVDGVLHTQVEIIIIFCFFFVFFFFLTFAFITKHNSTKHYLQCKTHYATLLTEKYLWCLQCRLLVLAIQYWIWLLPKNKLLAIRATYTTNNTIIYLQCYFLNIQLLTIHYTVYCLWGGRSTSQ